MEAVVIVWCGVSINPAQPVALADSIASLLERQRSMSFSFLILSVTVVFLQEEIVCVCVCVWGDMKYLSKELSVALHGAIRPQSFVVAASWFV